MYDVRIVRIIHTLILFATYIAGTGISWWDSEVPHLKLGTETPTAI